VIAEAEREGPARDRTSSTRSIAQCAQQDAFLPQIAGTVVLVGAPNPSFEVNSAPLSRCRSMS
jgi:hypothetical protein